MKGILIGVAVLVTGLIVWFIAKPKAATAEPTKPQTAEEKAAADKAKKDKEAADAKAKLDKEAAEKAAIEAARKAAEEAAKPKCIKRKTESVNYFSMKWGDDLKAFVADASGKGYSLNHISHVAAFCKGMDIELSMASALLYAKEIREFMAKNPPLKRDRDFATEIQNQIYETGSLQCEPEPARLWARS